MALEKTVRVFFTRHRAHHQSVHQIALGQW